jgi:hypothetical protein
MKRYHKKIYFPKQGEKDLEKLTARLNGLTWRYTRHSIDGLKCRAVDLEAVLNFIKNTKLESKDIFEYYELGEIVKACYRLPYTENTDIILVISNQKEIITIYTNTAGDNHITLNSALYIKE